MSKNDHRRRAPDDDPLVTKGLPYSSDAERFVLGAILLDESNYSEAAAQLTEHDFHLERHRRIWAAIARVVEARNRLDRINVAEELQRANHLESVGGVSYLVTLDDGLPQLFSVGSFIRIVKEKSSLRAIVHSAHATMNRALMGDDLADDIVKDVTTAFLAIRDARADSGLIPLRDIVEGFEGGINALLDPSKRADGVRTGFLRFDEMTGGLREGELIILAARPSMGKTALAMDMARRIALRSEGAKPVAVFSLEMSKQALLERLICADSYTDALKFRLGYLSADERHKLYLSTVRLADAPIHIDDSSSATLFDISLKARRMQAEHGLGLIIIDYLQLMSLGHGASKSSRRGDSYNRNQELGVITRGLKILAKDLRVPVMVLSQLSRAPDTRTGDHRPQLSDLRDSGAIEQDADLVAFVYREEVYKPDREDLKGLAKLILAKQRNGPVGDVNLVFLKTAATFENAHAYED